MWNQLIKILKVNFKAIQTIIKSQIWLFGIIDQAQKWKDTIIN